MSWSTQPPPPGAWDALEIPADHLGGVREHQADFETPAHVVDGASTTRRPDAISFDMLEWVAVGPRAVSDGSAGLVDRVWKVNARTAGEVRLSRSSIPAQEWSADNPGTWEPEALLFTYAGPPIDQVDLGFDQLGSPVVCAERATGPGGAPEVWLHWLDPRVGSPSFQALRSGRTPRVLLDAPERPEESDVLIAFAAVDGSAVYLLQQRDFYATPILAPATGEDLRVEELARAVDGRLHLYYTRHNADLGSYELVILESAPYPIYLSDSVASTQTARWCELVTVILAHDFTEAVSASQTIAAATAVDLVVTLAFDEDKALSTHRIANVGAVDLVLQLTPGPETSRPTQRIRSLAAVALVITTTPSPESSRPSQRIRTVAIVTSQTVASPPPETPQPTQRIRALTLVTL